jgi:hypothetical protein
MKFNYRKLFILLILPLNLFGQVVTQSESVESNFFPMPGWKTRKGIVAEFSRIAAASTTAPTAPALTTGTLSTGGPAVTITGGGANVVMLNSFISSTDTAYLISKPFDFSNNAGTNPTFSFWVYRDAGYPGVNDRLEVFWSGVSPGLGATLTPINHQGGSNVIPRLTTAFPTAINGAGWYEFKFTLPAATYNSKRNYFVIKGISALGNNMYLDNFTVNTYPTAMLATDVQFNAVQQNSATTSQGTTNQWILGVRCVVGGNSGCGALITAGTNNPVKLDSLLFNTNGCSNISTDILNAKVYYTGGYDQFNATYVSPFPATTGIAGASYPKPIYGNTLTGGQIATNLDFINSTGNCFYLEYDTTYFWLVYDMKAAAGGSNYVDGDFRGAVVGGPTSCPSPVGSANCISATTTTYTLVGASQISDVSYCVPTYSLGTSWANYTNNDYIHGVSLIGYGGTAINATTNAVPLQLNTLPCYPSCRFVKHPPDYEYRSPTVSGNTVTLQQGVTYSITVQVGTYFSNNNISAWIDFNRDGVFDNAPMVWAGTVGSSTYTGERLGYASLNALGTATWTFTVPSTGAIPAPFQGSTRLRVREWFAASTTAMHPCNPGTYGEAEDFIVTIIPNCNPSYKLWLGNTNDWNNPANWCPSVPTITDSVVISKAIVDPGTRQYFNPVIKSGVQANCRSLTISNQDSLFVDAANPGSTALKIAGNLNNNGYLNVATASNPTNNAVFPNSAGTLLNYWMTPLCGKSYKAAQTQIIYLASDLSQLGMQAGDKITAIQLNVKNNDLTVPTRYYQNFAIGYVNSVISSFTFTVPIAGVTNVYTNANQPIVYGLNTFGLGTPITWDGTSNIVIQYTFTNPASTGSANNDFIDITQSTGRNSTLVLGRLLTSVQTVPAAGAFVGQVATDITGNGSPVANVANTVSALMTLRPNATFIWDRPYGKPKLVLQGDFINNGNFNAGKSLFVMDSSRTQLISGSRAISFYTFSMSKSATNRSIILNNDTVSIQDTFFLGTGQMVMNGKPLYMKWPNPNAFSRIIQGTGIPGTGLLISENANSIVNWSIGQYASPTTLRTIPFGSRLDTTNSVPVITYIPLSFLHKQGDLGIFKAGTKNWASNTLPGPPTVTHTNIFNSTSTNAANTVDRYWMIGKTGPQNPAANYPIADITFRMSTNATVPQVSERPTTMSALKPGFAQPWRVIDSTWLRISALATTNVSTVNSAVGNGTTITYTTSAAHTFVVGQAVSIVGAMTPAGYNVINAIITAVPSTTSFSVAGIQTGVSSGTSTATGAPSCGSGLPAATPYNQQQTTLSYAQSYSQVAATTSDSIRVTSWDWPTVPTLSCPNLTTSSPVGDLTPWTVSVNTTPLGTSYSTPIITTDSTQDVSCVGAATGKIYISVTGSVSPYTYLWNDGATTEDRTNLATGTYIVTVTGADGNFATKSFVIGLIAGTPIITTDSTQNINCIGTATGKIAISVSGGIAPYTYLWNDGATTEDRTNLTPGNYTVTVTGCNGATASRTFTLNLVSNVPVITTDSLINLTCATGSSSGKIYISVSNGVAPYSYLWNDGAITEDRTNLSIGNYTVTVTGCNGIVATKAFVIGYSVNSPIITTDSIVNTTCSGLQANGKIFITVSGGLNPYTYLWSDGATIEDRQSLVAGNYTVTVTGCNGFASNKTFTVTMPTNNPIVTLDSTQNATCAGVANGFVYVTVSNGVAPYSYLWNDGSTSEDRPSLAAGSYTLTVTGCNGFATTSNFNISAAAGALGSIGTINGNSAICLASDYTYSLPLVSNATYYAWTVPANASVLSGQGTNIVVIRFSSSYSSGAISVVASNSCQSSTASTINVSLLSNSTIGIVGAITGTKNGVCPGTIKTYSITSVTNATNYVWTAPANSTITSGQGTNSIKVQFATGFTSGTLNVNASNACVTSNTVSASINSTAATPGTITGPLTNLCGATSGYSISNVLGATNYTWTASNGGVVTSGQGTKAVQITWPVSNISSATVCVTANNACGSSLPKCLSSLTTLPLKPVKINGPKTVCANQTNLVYSVAAEPNVSYAWGVPAGCSIVSGQGSATATINWGTVSGNIRVTAYNQCGSQAIKYQSISITCRENESGSSAYIVPNPSNGVAVLYLPNNEEHCTIIIHDLLGRVVFTNETFNDKVDLELGGYHDGIYLVSVIRDNNLKEVFKMVIEK